MNEIPAISAEDIKKRIANNQLEKAIEELLLYNEEYGNEELQNLIIIQSGKFKKYKKDALLDTVDYVSLTRSMVNISLSLLDIIDRFPKEEIAEKDKKRGITEGRYKSQLLVLLFLGKAIIFLYILTIWQSGGLPYSGFVGTLSIIIPVFATYLSTAWEDMLSKKNILNYSNKLLINNSVRMGGYIAIATYYFALFLVLHLKTIGQIPDPMIKIDEMTEIPTFKYFFALLALVESTLGVYVHRLIFSFFKRDI